MFLYNFFHSFLADHTLCLVVIASGITGIVSGLLGVFTFLRGQSLLADAIAHASLPGIALTFLITQTTNPALLLFGGGCFGMFGSFFVRYITIHTTLKKDAALGVLLSVFFGLGIVLMTLIQQYHYANQGVLNKFLFGSAALVVQEDIPIMLAFACFVIAVVCALWKECVLMTFDPLYTHTIGYRPYYIDLILTSLLVITIMIGLNIMGVILMSALCIGPAVSARQWTTRVASMALLSATLGLVCAVTGALASSVYNVPTGPAIIILVSCAVIFSLYCAPYYKRLRAQKLFYR